MDKNHVFNDDTLLLGLPLYVRDFGYIKQPSIKEISSIGYENYMKIMSPLFIDSSTDSDDVNLLDVIFSQQSKDLLVALMQTLSFFFDEDIKIENLNIKIGDELILNSENFSSVQNAIMKIFGISKPDKPKETKELTPKQQEIKDKLEYHRQRHAKANQPTLKEIINVVIHKGNFSYLDVLEMTYYQLINSYLVISGLSAYDEFIMYKTSPNFEIKEDLEHWSKTLKKI